MDLKKYYGSKGKYLDEHKDYFSNDQLKDDVNFLIEALLLKKSDKILDLACGHGRHTIELKKMGFNIDGLDFSDHLLHHAKNNSTLENLQIKFYKQNIHNIKLKTKYDKIFLFFSEFGLFEAEKVLNNVSKLLKKNGLFLLDTDNLFRLFQYLIKNPKSRYSFDFNNMLLKEKNNSGLGVRYYTPKELNDLFIESKLKSISVYGNYKKEELGVDSKRIILVGKKI